MTVGIIWYYLWYIFLLFLSFDSFGLLCVTVRIFKRGPSFSSLQTHFKYLQFYCHILERDNWIQLEHFGSSWAKQLPIWRPQRHLLLERTNHQAEVGRPQHLKKDCAKEKEREKGKKERRGRRRETEKEKDQGRNNHRGRKTHGEWKRKRGERRRETCSLLKVSPDPTIPILCFGMLEIVKTCCDFSLLQQPALLAAGAWWQGSRSCVWLKTLELQCHNVKFHSLRTREGHGLDSRESQSWSSHSFQFPLNFPNRAPPPPEQKAMNSREKRERFCFCRTRPAWKIHGFLQFFKFQCLKGSLRMGLRVEQSQVVLGWSTNHWAAPSATASARCWQHLEWMVDPRFDLC